MQHEKPKSLSNDDRKRVSAEDFLQGNVYIDYPYEKAKFRWDKEAQKVYRRWYGEPEMEISYASKLYLEAQMGGWRITAEAYRQD